jgi:hypothetical protein
MNSGWNSARAFVALAMVSVLAGACQPNDAGITAPSTINRFSTTPKRTMNGVAGQMPAFYDGEVFTVNMMELSEDASAALIAKNSSINKIYATNDLDDPQDFFPVIDAIQGDGFNPMWQQILIVFNPGFTPHQFVSDDQVEAAAAGPNPEITLVVTDEMYRCSVVGAK